MGSWFFCKLKYMYQLKFSPTSWDLGYGLKIYMTRLRSLNNLFHCFFFFRPLWPRHVLKLNGEGKTIMFILDWIFTFSNLNVWLEIMVKTQFREFACQISLLCGNVIEKIFACKNWTFWSNHTKNCYSIGCQ